MSLSLLLCVVSLSGCGQTIKANGGVAVEKPHIPDPETAMDSDVIFLLEDQRTALKQCNANFETK